MFSTVHVESRVLVVIAMKEIKRIWDDVLEIGQLSGKLILTPSN